MLQAKLAEHAPELIAAGLIDLKTLIATIQGLETSRNNDDAGNVERRLQDFLRGGTGSPSETPAEAIVQ